MRQNFQRRFSGRLHNLHMRSSQMLAIVAIAWFTAQVALHDRALAQSLDQSRNQSHNQQSPNKSALRTPHSAMTWRALFNGKSLNNWRGYKTDTPPAGWRVEGGALVKDAQVG